MFDAGSANWRAAQKFVFDKLFVANKGTKKLQNTFQHFLVCAAGFEVTMGINPDAAGMQMHTDDKQKLHFAAYSRHVTWFFSSTLRSLNVPHWLTAKWLLHKDVSCKKPFANDLKALWKLFTIARREVLRDYLPIYRTIMKEGTGSGTVWLEKLEKLRQLLYNIEERRKLPKQQKVFSLLPTVLLFANAFIH